MILQVILVILDAALLGALLWRRRGRRQAAQLRAALERMAATDSASRDSKLTMFN